MGPSDPIQALFGSSDAAASLTAATLVTPRRVSGMAIMSTHPRDFSQVQELAQTLPTMQTDLCIVPCFGVHPWWLHELTDKDWERSDVLSAPMWIHQLEGLLRSHPNAIVGEMGLDGFHFDELTNALVSPMEQQVEAFRLQMELAVLLQRPVSVHSVQAFGPLLSSLSSFKTLPPKVYFHAFGGKVGTVDQIVAICERRSCSCYFGFAPVVNFRSPKTADVIRKVGIERLVLETDHEDAALVYQSLADGIRFVAAALNMDEDEVVERTTFNAFDLYGLHTLLKSPSSSGT